jgi:hypothetical protein
MKTQPGNRLDFLIISFQPQTGLQATNFPKIHGANFFHYRYLLSKETEIVTNTYVLIKRVLHAELNPVCNSVVAVIIFPLPPQVFHTDKCPVSKMPQQVGCKIICTL